MASPAAPTSSTTFQSLLSSTLETIFHQLLYSRSIYPADSFVLHRYLGVRCHASRVPAVGAYISDFIRVAVPALVAGIGDEVSFVVLEEEVVGGDGGGGEGATGVRQVGERTGRTKTLERFVFQFRMDDVIRTTQHDVLNGKADTTYFRSDRNDDQMDIEELGSKEVAIKLDAQLANDAKIQLERAMRECLLRLLAFRGRRRRRGEKAENVSFKLCLHVKDGDNSHSGGNGDSDEKEVAISLKSCPELMKALDQGEWFMPEENSVLFSSSPETRTAGISNDENINSENMQFSTCQKGLLQPIKSVILPSCGMRMQIGMEACPF
mmetsp:Transcript_22432/g.46903  ORF Transcript_22432/g.46903 Transcript_22432/m.46903 type:complete len:323 (+) Transcript_22432:72-1040(+)